MTSNDTKRELNTNQKRALVALLENGTVTAAAAACGLAEKTLYRYLSDDTFKSELDQAVRGLIDAAAVRLYSGQDNALETLSNIMTRGRRESDRRLAAVSWLTFAVKYQELQELKTAVSGLEVRINELENKSTK